MKFNMVIKGYKYVSEDGKITLVKEWYKVRRNETVHSFIDSHQNRSRWNIFGLDENMVYSMPTLNEAKRFVNEMKGE